MPKNVLRSPNYVKLSAWSTKLIYDLAEQYVGDNNGNLCATWVFMRDRGWKSKDTLNNAIHELRYYELIVQTQFGGLNTPSLYAFPWLKIDKAKKETGLRIGEKPKGWQTEKMLYSKVSTQKRNQRRKTQVRLSGQTATAIGAVSEKLKVVK